MPYDIIILGGQSNAEGYGLGETAVPFEPDERNEKMYLIVIEFAKWLKQINYSDSTIQNYIRTLDLFDDYVCNLTF